MNISESDIVSSTHVIHGRHKEHITTNEKKSIAFEGAPSFKVCLSHDSK